MTILISDFFVFHFLPTFSPLILLREYYLTFSGQVCVSKLAVNYVISDDDVALAYSTLCLYDYSFLSPKCVWENACAHWSRDD